eukprot:3933619-Amphidinium_carterae.1
MDHWSHNQDQRPLALKDGSLSRCEPMPEPGHKQRQNMKTQNPLASCLPIQQICLGRKGCRETNEEEAGSQRHW